MRASWRDLCRVLALAHGTVEGAIGGEGAELCKQSEVEV
jgi:hypothetical protein